MKENKEKAVPEVVVPTGYSIDEILDTNDNDFGEEPILTREVRIRFE